MAKQTKNVPYVKQYKDGFLINPIERVVNGVRVAGSYVNRFPNRRTRRSKQRLISNKAGDQVVITQIGRAKFVKTTKRIQTVNCKHVRDKEGNILYSLPIPPKTVIHYDLN